MAESVLPRELVAKPSESNAQQELSLPLLASQIIDIATDHANRLGIGYHNLEPRGLGWVLSRLSVEMARWPKTGEHYILRTWVESWNSHFSERCFSVTAMDGEVLGYARTVWVIIDLESHQSAGTAGLQLPPDMVEGAKCPIPKFPRHRPFEAQREMEYVFKYSDLDFYRHVNTVRYIALLLNQFTLEDFDRNILSRFDIAFAHEAKYGETALIRSIDEEVDAPSMIAEKKKSVKRTFDISIDSRQILTSSIVLTEI